MDRMLRRPAILGGIALLGAGVIALFLLSSRTREGDDPVREDRGAIEKTAGSAPASGTAHGPQADVAAVAMPGDGTGWTLRGRLVRYPDPDAIEPTEPVGGALVRLALSLDSKELRPDFESREVHSRPDGTFVLETVPGSARYRLDVDAKKCALRAVGFELPSIEGSATKEIPDMVLDEPASLVVHLRESNGFVRDDGKVTVSRYAGPFDSLPEETLDAWEEELEVARRGPGEHVLDRAPSGACKVSGSAPGCVRDSVFVILPRNRPVELLLSPGFRLSGAVRTSAGEPIEGAEVRVEKHVPERLVRTGVDGRFEFDGLSHLMPCSLSATADGFRVTSREVPPGLEGIELVLSPEGVIAGRVLCAESGEPIGSARIVRAGEVLARTDEKGSFQVRKLEPGPYEWIEVHHDEYAPSSLDTVTLGSGERVDGIEVRLQKGVRVEGRVETSDGGAPVAGAQVRAFSSGTRPGCLREGVTSADGSFSLSGMPQAEYSVSVRASEHLELDTRAQVPGGQAEWTFAMEIGGAVRGRVLGPDGRPSPGVEVHLACRQETLERESHRVATDLRGCFRIGGLPPLENYHVLFSDPRQMATPRWIAGIRVAPGEEVVLDDFRFERGRTVRGRVTDSAGAPLRGAQVTALPSPEDEMVRKILDGTPFWNSDFVPHMARDWTGPGGDYQLEGLLPIRYEVSVWPMNRIPPPSRVITVYRGDLEGIDFIAPAGSGVSGRVVDAAGEPVSCAEIESHDSVSFASVHTTTDAKGRFTIEGLPPGPASLMAHGPGYTLKFAHVAVPSEGNVVVLSALGTISGRLEVASGPGKPPICKVKVTAPLQLSTEATSDGSGRFDVPAPPGSCRIHAEGEGFVSPRMKLDLEPGERREIVLELERTGDVQVSVKSASDEPFPDEGLVLLETTRSGEPPLEMALDQGQCYFEGVLPGTVKVVAFVSGQGAAVVDEVHVVPGKTAEVIIPVGADRGISGRVFRGGEPVQGARVIASRLTGTAETHTSPGGVYELRDIEPGRCELAFVGPGTGKPLRRVVRVPETGGLSLDVHLDRSRVSGSVTSGGKPVQGARITFQADEGNSWLSNPTDDEGGWSFELEAPGRYVLQAYRGKDAVGPSRTLVLESPEDELRVDIELEKN
jgi:hypothetical protein